MFGYILPLNGDLKVKELNYFKSYYCGLCYTIKNDFGNIPRLTLNYDMTFISFLLDGLSSNTLDLDKTRCLRHPTKDIILVKSTDSLKYCASLSFLLFNYKLDDNKLDDNDFKSKCFSLLLKPYNTKIPSSLIPINNIMKENLSKINDYEKNKNFESLDEISDPFGVIMGSILKEYPNTLINDSTELRANLYNFGHALGKWIYLIDARDDLLDDLKDNKFNPISVLYNKDNTLSYNEIVSNINTDYEFLLLSLINDCKELLEKISFSRHHSIIENIVNLGLVSKSFEILKK